MKFDFYIITGLSGSGKTQALRIFEDLGFFCVDNLPSALVAKFAQLAKLSNLNEVAVVIDIRSIKFFGDNLKFLNELKALKIDYKIIYIESSSQTIIRRFSETRRRHPLVYSHKISIYQAIDKERQKLKNLRDIADYIIDTSHLSPYDLKSYILSKFSINNINTLVNIYSFGYKYGLPIESDYIFDVRFIKNPYYVSELRSLTGKDVRVRDYVLKQDSVELFLNKLEDFLLFVIPKFQEVGKSSINIAIGCTGGRHRSVVLAEEIYRRLSNKLNIQLSLQHRELLNEKK